MWQKGLSGCHDTVEAADMAGVTVLVVLLPPVDFRVYLHVFFAAFYLFFDFTAKSVAVMCSDSPATNLDNLVGNDTLK